MYPHRALMFFSLYLLETAHPMIITSKQEKECRLKKEESLGKHGIATKDLTSMSLEEKRKKVGLKKKKYSNNIWKCPKISKKERKSL